MFSKILIANRGEIACRIIKTAKRMGIRTVAVYSDADQGALHVTEADEAVHIGPAPAVESYLQIDKIIEAALKTGAEAIHPGYGFLSENPEFAEKLAKAGLVFIGPPAKAIRKMGLKDEAKKLMEQADVPVVPGYHGETQTPDVLAKKADEIGYPVLIKARAGGGGKGMRLVESPPDFETALAAAQREGQASFGDNRVLIEKYITTPRHIEVQIFGDSFGNIVHLYERDCSMQRRHQKVIEEAPAPDMSKNVRDAMTNAAIRAAREINYQGAGTVEFIADGSGPLHPDKFWFMEMNTRLQVEHPVTEAITGQDLVEWQIRVAAGEPLPLVQDDISINGHAFEARIYAEDPSNDFLPAPGYLHHIHFGSDVRIETGIKSRDTISPYYDPMIAKLITHGPTRTDALHRLRKALQETMCIGTETNVPFLARLTVDADFTACRLDTGLIERKQGVLTRQTKPTAFAILVAWLTTHDLDPKKLGWRHWGQATQSMDFLYKANQISAKIMLQKNGTICVTRSDQTDVFKNVSRSGRQVSAQFSHENITAEVITLGHITSVKIEAEQFNFEVPDLLDIKDKQEVNSDHIVAPMTGVVTVVHAKPGDMVKKDTPLLVIEAMKMEHMIRSPRKGHIEKISCAVSHSVEEGAPLITLKKVSE